MEDYLSKENELTKKIFNLEEILDFQLEHDVQIIRMEDYNYLCFIDGHGYGVSITPMCALTIGIKQYKEHFEKDLK